MGLLPSGLTHAPAHFSLHSFLRSFFIILLILISINHGRAQSLDSSPYSNPAVSSFPSTEMSTIEPSNPLGLPGSSAGNASSFQSIPISSNLFTSIIPIVPNLQIGYLYSFGKDLRSGRLTADYLLPMNLGWDDAIFAQAHLESQNYWKTPAGYSQHRLDMSLGGGYRKLFGNSLLGGVNGFYDTSRLFGKWYSSGSIGLEMVTAYGNNDFMDLNFNYYGGLFNNAIDIFEVFRGGPSNFDCEAGYSHNLYSDDYGLRVKFAGYKFDLGTSIYGWRAGVDLVAWDGVCEFTYETGHDRFNGTYQTVGGMVNLPLQFEKVFSGQSPFFAPNSSCSPAQGQGKCQRPPTKIPCVKPVPIYVDSSNLRKLLGRPVRRQFTSYAVPIPDPDPPVAWLATGQAVVVFSLDPKYTAALLNNTKPSTIKISILANSRGDVDITGLQLHVKESDTVWLLPLPDWTTAMGNSYTYNLFKAEITSLWEALSTKPDRSIAEIRFNQLNGALLQNPNILLTITQ